MRRCHWLPAPPPLFRHFLLRTGEAGRWRSDVTLVVARTVTSRPRAARYKKGTKRPRYCEKLFNMKRQGQEPAEVAPLLGCSFYRGLYERTKEPLRNSQARDMQRPRDIPGGSRAEGASRDAQSLSCGCAGHNLIGFSRIQREKGERSDAGTGLVPVRCCQLCASHIQFSSFSVWSSVWCKPKFSSLA